MTRTHMQVSCLVLAMLVSADALTHLTSASVRKQKTAVTIPSGFFGDISAAESTYTTEALDAGKDNPTWSVQYGRDPAQQNSAGLPFVENMEIPKAEWFQESASGGPIAAWQTDYPALKKSVAGNHAEENRWRDDPVHWVQDYNPLVKASQFFSQVDGHADGPQQAKWFDNSVQQIDGFGREKMPDLKDGRSHIPERAPWQERQPADMTMTPGWQERSVNTTIECSTPGCTGKATLSLFDASQEEAELCSLSIYVYPTDYDSDDPSRPESIETWKLNGQIAMSECKPQMKGCVNTTADGLSSRVGLHPCVQSLNVDKVVNTKGTIEVEGKNSKYVDDCPYKGQLLSGIAMATCMVRSTTTTTTTTTKFFQEVPLMCKDPGCTAEALIGVQSRDPKDKNKKVKCMMNVTVFQTDFDSAEEQIDFIEVEGKNISKASVPGKNPCQMTVEGKTVTPSDQVFTAVKEYDVTSLIPEGDDRLRIKAAISDLVDECAYQGNYLHGNVAVRCG